MNVQTKGLLAGLVTGTIVFGGTYGYAAYQQATDDGDATATVSATYQRPTTTPTPSKTVYRPNEVSPPRPTVIVTKTVKPFGYNEGDCPAEDSCWADYDGATGTWVIKKGENPHKRTYTPCKQTKKGNRNG